MVLMVKLIPPFYTIMETLVVNLFESFPLRRKLIILGEILFFNTSYSTGKLFLFVRDFWLFLQRY